MVRSLDGKTPLIAPSAFISEAAYIIGDVVIGENSNVMPGAVIRADTGRITIGSYVTVEDNCVIHSGEPRSESMDVFIGDKVTIGHGAVLNCRRIGHNVLVGINATLLHDAEIGNYCIIGACTLVMRGMKIPDKSFVVGVPGKITGTPNEDHMWWVEEGVDYFEELVQLYKKEKLS